MRTVKMLVGMMAVGCMALPLMAQPGGGGGGGGEGGKNGQPGGERPRRERAPGGPGGEGRPGGQMSPEKAKAAWGAQVAADKAASAVAVLGTFNRQYDVMTDALVGLKLEAGKQQQAMEVVERFVAAQEKARPAAGGEGDREGAREAMTAARNSMREEMAKVLSADEMKKFEETLPGARGRGQGGGEGGKGGGKGGEGGKGGGEGGGKGGGGR